MDDPEQHAEDDRAERATDKGNAPMVPLGIGRAPDAPPKQVVTPEEFKEAQYRAAFGTNCGHRSAAEKGKTPIERQN